MYSVTSQNYGVDFGNDYHCFKFLNAATSAIQIQHSKHEVFCKTIGRLLDDIKNETV